LKPRKPPPGVVALAPHIYNRIAQEGSRENLLVAPTPPWAPPFLRIQKADPEHVWRGDDVVGSRELYITTTTWLPLLAGDERKVLE